MLEPTEGIDQSSLSWPFLRRNIPPQDANPEQAYRKSVGNLVYDDEQSAFISPDTYKLLLHNNYSFERPQTRPGKIYKPGTVGESEPFREKFIRNTAWMKDQSADYVESVKADWERNVKEGMKFTEEDA